ncbi:HEAT repeat domain-containing protein [Parachryseolinea silvisoli]|uniref:HEAT repeat domain-containing protein n=1 Tax=Parachryseolinea silvisoli TaxID=2873601 RepID=UPI002265A1C0|nr:HEAT repeat domain-containing protein [Parachryseolinea silvisoli]MCD9018191.1 HEAT repeat domain-containing protein [Parachryseolinea silvisoli]
MGRADNPFSTIPLVRIGYDPISINMTSGEDEESTNPGCGLFIFTLFLAGGAISHYNKAYINKYEDYSEFAVVLRASPIYDRSGGEAPKNFIDFKLTNDKTFSIMGCECEATRKSVPTRLTPGDTIVIRAKEWLNGEKYDVYSVRSPRYGTILDPGDIRSCSSSQARWFLGATIVCAIGAIIAFFYALRKENKLVKMDNPTWNEFVRRYQQVLAGTISIPQFAKGARELLLGENGNHHLNVLLGREYDNRNYDGVQVLVIAALQAPSKKYTTTLCLILDARLASVNNDDIVDLLCDIGDPAAVPSLIRAAKTEWPLDEHMHINKKCIWTLRKICTDEAIRGLQELTQHTSVVINHEAQKELERINNA